MRYDHLLEVGIGQRTDLADRLADHGCTVTAVDIAAVDVPPAVRFVRADIHTIDPTRFEPVGAVYARRLPPELHRATYRLARSLDADLYFTTLGGEFPAIDIDVTSDDSETFYSVRADESNRI